LIQGPKVQTFEQEILAYLKPGHLSVLVSSCTAALHLALLALGVKKDDEVVVPAYSWPATANVVELVGARPIFVDIDENTFNLDPESLKALWKNKPATEVKALIVVHAFGLPAAMADILKLAQEAKLPVIEDAACALGSTLNGQAAGTFGEIGCFSFHPRKILTTGEGGLVTSGDSQILKTVKALRNHGLDPESPLPEFILPGFNYRLTDLQAALGLAQLKRFPEFLQKRRVLADLYTQIFQGSPIVPQQIPPEARSNYQSYVVKVPAQVNRDSLIQKLAARGIAAGIGTWHIPLTKYYREKYGFKVGSFPKTDIVFQQSLTLPLHHGLTQNDITFVGNTLLELL
jgi:dTDP-4-amino-4,6-dideoxygalactose transaminase